MNQNDRPRFYEGQYLGAADLAAAVDYARRSNARHDLGAHTWGIAAGLELVERPLPSGAVDVSITPGYAWDGYGRPIVMLASQRLGAELFRNFTSDTAPEGDLVKVWLSYAEAKTRNPAPGFEICEGDQRSRVVESYAVEIGELDATRKVVVNGRTLEAQLARQETNPKAPLLHDEAVPYQAIPDNGALPRWPILIGYVRWFKQGSAPGYLKGRDVDRSRAARRYVGVVAEEVLAADGVLRLRDRNKAPSPHYAPPAAGGGDLLRLEGHARIEGDVRLLGGRLEWRGNAGSFDGVPMLMRRNESNGYNGKSLEVGFSPTSPAPSGKQRLVFGPVTLEANGAVKEIEPRLVVRDDGKVGLNEPDPQQMLVLKSPKKTRLEIGYVSASLPWSATNGGTDEASFVINQQSAGSDKEDADLALMRDRRKRLVLGDKNTIVSSQGTGNIRFHVNYEETGDREAMRVTEDARVAIGVAAAHRPLHVESGEIHSGGAAGGYSFADRGATAFVETPSAGERWVWYASAGKARLWAGGDKLAVTHDGDVGIGVASPAARLHLSTANQAHGNLKFLSPGADVEYDGGNDKLFVFRHTANGVTCFMGGKVGIGTTTPDTALEVRGSVKLGDAGEYYALGAPVDWRMAAGRVSSAGAASGSGFTSVRLSTGHYRVSFSPSFDAAPVAVATPVDAANFDVALTVGNVSASAFEVWCKDVVPSGEGNMKNSAFNFVAVGPRS